MKKSEIAAILKNTALEAAQTHAEKLNLYDMFRGNLKVCLLSHTTNSLSLVHAFFWTIFRQMESSVFAGNLRFLEATTKTKKNLAHLSKIRR